MTILEERVEIRSQLDRGDDHLTHFLCCEDDHVAWCGKRWPPGTPNAEDEAVVDCVVCLALEPMFDSGLCVCPRATIDDCA